ncbi:TRAP transporter substrate-binding protein [Ramlibacter rhizophilus]|uniref:TRAP transporter substrate-binding protein n=1 Tax=Ramlibacter rhizophilus TaxID=1781167 RepID=A0A4Z0BKC7_9BURK|nr:TRAP transporter substrate-binding protein [Ramlibacter rhizophilus]TFY99766.1 TRAP transporter substrate-binding protein [Ramlibacter rhizophilus]
MQRRSLLKSGAAIALGAPALHGFAQETVTLKFHTFMSPASNVWLYIHKAWMDKVEKDSNGRIKFEAYPAMQLGGTPPNLYDQARDGVVDISWTLPGLTGGRFPRAEVFELPFMMKDAEGTSRAAWEFYTTMMRDEFQDTRVLAFHTHGRGLLHTRSKLVKSPADLRGVKMRGPTRMATRLLGHAGAIPVGMPLPAIPDALSKGTVDGVALPWEVTTSVKVLELCKYHSEFPDSSPALYTSVFVMSMNKPKYESLPPDLKKVIDANSGADVSAWMGKVQQDYDPIARKQAIERGNVVHTIGPAETAQFQKLTSSVDEEWVADMNKKGFDGKKLLATAKSLITKYSKNG